MDNPLVSVLMVTYNQEKYIIEAIQSVLTSTYTNFELIIVDDCSKDNTFAIAQAYSVKDRRIKVFVNENNLGDYPNRNKAASYAQGKYIKYLDGDDIMYPHCLYVMVNSMEKFPDAGYGLSSFGDEKTPYPICISPKETYLEHFNGFGHFNRSPGSAIIKREIFNNEGGFSGERFIGDIDLWLRLSQKYYLVKFPVDLYWSRIHSLSESSMSQKQNISQVSKKLVQQFLLSPLCPIDLKEIKNRSLIFKLKNRLKKMFK